MGASEAKIQIKAKVASQIFPRPPQMIGGDSSFGVIRWRILESYAGNPVTNRRREATIKGLYGFAPAQEKEYNIQARSAYHPKYGQQYELLSIEEDTMRPEQQRRLEHQYNARAFLATFLTDRQIEAMYRAFDDPLAVLAAHDTESLKTVRGVGDYIAPRILERYDQNRDVAPVYLEIGDVGLTPSFVRRLTERYGSTAALIDKVRHHPYDLAQEVSGIGFERADRIALRAGIEPRSPERILGFILYCLEEQAQRGNSWTNLGTLTAQIYDAFGGAQNILEEYAEPDAEGSRNNFQAALREGISRGHVAVEWTPNRDGSSRIYLERIRSLEEAVARELWRLAQAPDRFETDGWEERVAALEENRNWEFTPEQRDGIRLGVENTVCMITGGAGTGKSSLVAGILAALNGCSFVQTALSGKAAARLEETTGQPGSTIHRLLGFDPDSGFAHNENNPLDADIVILDEISLVGGEIFLSLLRAIPTGAKLIILGDMGQLEAIGCMNVAHDLLSSPAIPAVELTRIHRQAQKSGIKLAAAQVRAYRSPVNRNFEGTATIGDLRDMHFILYEDSARIMDATIRHFRDRFASPLVSKNAMNIQVLSPLRDRGELSVNRLNQALQAIVNPQAQRQGMRVHTGRGDEFFVLAPGDKVMCIRNNYNLKNAAGRTTFVFNGWAGVVKGIGHDSVQVAFPHLRDPVIFPARTVREDLMLGYACTIHKYQGSSAPVIIGVMDYTTPPQMRTAELIYTMITRAEKECLLIGQSEAVDDAIHTSYVSRKQTFLPAMLEQMMSAKHA